MNRSRRDHQGVPLLRRALGRLKTASLAWSGAVSLPSPPLPSPSSFFSMSSNTSGRQIIQITAVSPSANTIATSSGSPVGGLCALCNDGTVWFLRMKVTNDGQIADAEWREVPSIPPLP
jgi:hypothetical protein